MSRGRVIAILLAGTSLLTAACSSDADDTSGPASTAAASATEPSITATPPTVAMSDTVATSDPTESSATADTGATVDTAGTDETATTIIDIGPSSCPAPTTTTPIDASPLGADGQDWDITSFDGTVIRAHWFPLPDLATGATAPTVLMGPGWGSAGDTNTAPDTDGSAAAVGVVGIAALHDARFNVLTWDPRGFGESTGTVEIDSAEYEGRDVQQLLDWVATQPQVELDGARDPRVGMFGASYGGGIQLVTAGIDCRIDALVPVIAWHSLRTSLFKADTPKIGWATFLSVVATGRDIDPTVARANASAAATATVDPADLQWFVDRGPGDAIDDITVPTLIIQGTVDTLFTLDEGATNYGRLHDNGVPSAMLWFCGGHGACLTDPGDAGRTADLAIAWLQRYVARLDATETVPAFTFVDQDGVMYTADEFPLPPADALAATGSGILALVADGGAGPADTASGTGLAPLVAPITPGPATNAVEVVVPAPADDTVLVGAPNLSLTYSGTVDDSDLARPTRVFAQLIDDATGLVLGNQITPIEVTLDGTTHTTEVPLEMIAFTFHPGSTVTLQLVATTVAYAPPRLGGSIDFSEITIELPAVTGATAAS